MKKKMHLSKKETHFKFFGLFLSLSMSLYGEITLGILAGIENNARMTLNDQNTHYLCEPFGIKTLERLIRDAENPNECQKSVDTLYTNYPHKRLFAQETLHLHQRYHYEKMDKGCILYANGPESYSEMLLNAGLAIVDERSDHKEWNAKLRRAGKRGMKNKESLYQTNILEKCKGKTL